MFWLTLLSAGEQSNKSIWRKTFFRFYFFRHRRKDSWEKFFEIFGKNYQWGFTRMLEKSFHFIKIRFNENHFSWIFWTTFLTVGVQRTDDRREKIFFEKSMFSLEFVFLKKFWLVWYDSSMGVHTNGDKIKKKSLKKKPTLSVFSKASLE